MTGRIYLRLTDKARVEIPKRRDWPTFRISRELYLDDTFLELTGSERGSLLSLMLLAGRASNRLSADRQLLTRMAQLGRGGARHIDRLIELGLLEAYVEGGTPSITDDDISRLLGAADEAARPGRY